MLKTKFKGTTPSVKTIAHFLFIAYICNDLSYDVKFCSLDFHPESGWTRNHGRLSLRIISPGYFVNGS